MDDGCPEIYPANEREVIGWIGLFYDNVVNCLVKDGDRTWILFSRRSSAINRVNVKQKWHTSHPSNGQGLRTENGKYERRHE
jgi:hypothetical protein